MVKTVSYSGRRPRVIGWSAQCVCGAWSPVRRRKADAKREARHHGFAFAKGVEYCKDCKAKLVEAN